MMSFAEIRNFVVVVILIFGGVRALKDVSVSIPLAAKIMDTVTLQCKYDLEDEPLYTLKWYKGSNEFYRFIPKELPSTQVFPLPGIDVDLDKSSPYEVVLRNVQPEVTGKYKCEVSTDAPNFFTAMAAGYMYVIDVPVEEPTISVDKELLDMDYTLRGNCTSPASFPPANITWYLNGKQLSNNYLKRLQITNKTNNTSTATNSSSNNSPQNNRRSPAITHSTIELEMNRNTFLEGKVRLSCVANVFHLYRKERETILEEERPRPRPSSVLGTRDATAGFARSATNNVVVFSFAILSLLCKR